MALTQIALAERSNPARFTQGGTARLVNCFVEEIGLDGKYQSGVYARDGLQGFALLPDANGGIRAMLEVDGTVYIVAGTQLWSLKSNGVATFIGSMSVSTTAPVYMARNRRATNPDVCIVCDGLMYYYRTSLSQVTDSDLLAPTSLDVVDGIFVIGTANNTWQVGEIDDAANWDPLSFERADSNPDAVVRIFSRQSEALIFGERSCEFWQNVGAADATGFQRTTVMDLGCLAPNSVARVDQTICWVAHDRTVRMLNGYAGNRISTHAVERDIEALADKSSITATSWVRDGHTFYMISSASWTWVYDTRRGWINFESYQATNWRVSSVVAAFSKVLAGDRDSASIFEMSPAFMDEAGDPLIMSVTCPPSHAMPGRVTCHGIYVDVERGVGTGQGAAQDIDPVLLVEWSKDGGATFQGPRELKMGQQGQRQTRLRAFRFGQSKDHGFVWRLSSSAKVSRAIYALHADMEAEPA